MFFQLTRSIEGKQSCQSMFQQRFERFDMDYLNSNNIYQLHLDSLSKDNKSGAPKNKSSSDDEHTEHINGQEYNVIDDKPDQSSSNFEESSNLHN